LAATVLVADDDADIVRFVEIYLRLEGFAVVTARDGPEVLAKAVAVHPDLVLLDVLMPGIDGYAVCGRMRADATLAAVPVIMVTANRGRLRLSHDGLLWHGRTFLLPTLSIIRSKADRLQDRIGAPDVAVSPVVAVLGGMVPGGQATSMGVTVVSARRLPGLLRNLPPNLTTERAREVAAQMNQRLDAEPAPEQPGNELRLEY
jgi:CheY-like chemotaxis protein